MFASHFHAHIEDCVYIPLKHFEIGIYFLYCSMEAARTVAIVEFFLSFTTLLK